MKYSQYNLIIKDKQVEKDKFILCNTFSGETFLIDRNTKDMIENKEIEALGEKTINAFISAGVILENDDFDEILVNRYFHEKEKFTSNVLNITLLLTMACNLRCIYCYEAAGIISSEFLSDDTRRNIFEFIKVQAEFRRSTHIAIWLFGGEPLLKFENNYDFLNDIKQYCVESGREFTTYIVTNGTLINSNYLDKLYEYNCQYIQITLDGTKEIHDKRRIDALGKGSFDATLAGIKQVVNDDRLPNPVIRINIDKTNIKEAENLLLFLSNEGLNGCSIDYGIVKGDTPSCSSYTGNCFLEEELGEVLEKLWIKTKELGFPINIDPMKRNMFCGLCSDSSFTIVPNGDVYKCWDFVNIEEHRIGRIGEAGTFLDTTSAYYKWMTRNPYDIEECKKCVYLPICGGGCVGVGYGHYGEYNKPGCYKVKGVFEEQIINKFKDVL